MFLPTSTGKHPRPRPRDFSNTIHFSQFSVADGRGHPYVLGTKFQRGSCSLPTVRNGPPSERTGHAARVWNGRVVERIDTMRVRAIAMGRLMALVTLACLWNASGVQAAIVDLDTPAGVADGQSFRFVFVTSGPINAQTGFPSFEDIGDPSYYDSFANSAGSSLTYNDVAISWQALVSTTTVGDLANALITPASTIPIYLVFTGALIATSGSDLWDGTIANPINRTELGEVFSGQVWTGSSSSGEDFGSLGLLGQNSPRIGLSSETGLVNTGWWFNSGSAGSGSSARLYAISQVLTAPFSSPSVPEPTSLAMLAMAGVGLLSGRSLRRRKVA